MASEVFSFESQIRVARAGLAAPRLTEFRCRAAGAENLHGLLVLGKNASWFISSKICALLSVTSFTLVLYFAR